ncbi:DUF2975 domain-containing protein [Gudongella sp. SC589]|uniref:DUF2975 domain-containing protein n=1 Tax=Gudongella sp. SC589 TaxID=3385990 RepID=UPI0039049CD2
MNKGTTLLLRGALIIMSFPILAICIFWLPSSVGFFPVSIVAGAYLTAMAYFFALYQAWKLLGLIDHNNAFSQEAVRGLGRIKHAALAIAGIYTLMLPFLYPIADLDDAPGLVGFPIIIVSASIVIATFAAVLQKLLDQAIKIKEDNDLTI